MSETTDLDVMTRKPIASGTSSLRGALAPACHRATVPSTRSPAGVREQPGSVRGAGHREAAPLAPWATVPENANTGVQGELVSLATLPAGSMVHVLVEDRNGRLDGWTADGERVELARLPERAQLLPGTVDAVPSPAACSSTSARTSVAPARAGS
jgi:hypothetical protein